MNTICSIASFYGVGLEVIRTDALNPVLTDQNYQANQAINSNMILTSSHSNGQKVSSKRRKIRKTELDNPIVLDSKPPQSFSMKYKPSNDEESYQTKGVEQALSIIEKCAQNGTWVLVSTPEFPSFWRKMCKKLEGLQVINTFRIFVDLQSLDMCTVPPSFLCDY